MRAFSEEHKKAWDRRDMGPPLAITPDVLAITVPMQGGAIVSTFCYALLEPDGGVHLIDPGWDSGPGLAALETALAGVGRGVADVRTMVVTHFHHDHLGLAPRIRDRTGAPVLLSRVEAGLLRHAAGPGRLDAHTHATQLRGWGVPEARIARSRGPFLLAAALTEFTPDRVIMDGEQLALGAHTLEVVLTPGHTSGHVCLVDHERGLLYAGDHLLPRIFAGVGLGALPGADPLDEFLNSLDAVNKYSHLTVLPGHEYPYRGAAARVEQIRSHHLRRTREVADLIPKLGEAPMWDYAERLTWSAGWEHTQEVYLESALRQTAQHVEFNRSGRAAPHLEKFARTRED